MHPKVGYGNYILKTHETEIGLGLTGFGIIFTFVGILLFFDKGFLAMGNILFLSGVTLTIGVKSTLQFFMKRQNFKGSVSFGVGFFFVLIGWPMIGMIVETYGFIVLFSGFWPTLAVFLQRLPLVGWVFQQPFVTSIISNWDHCSLRGAEADESPCEDP
ncbi:hypothetical protein HYC85_010662 [Camellia sinensis]|uniref:Uncharacterized protein n=1 Tax=Camellia sinensis TaxID=4442 RepID=A0A7J7HL48_CAMSI|nr:hypothetical protein HYC85_010662 [Camellia sinensis]